MKRFFFLSLILVIIAITNYSCKKCEGCTNPKAENYNKDAEKDDGTCIIKGCTNPDADNYDAEATVDDGFCLIKGCTDPLSPNYNAEANVDDGSCVVKGCTNPNAINYNPLATIDDGSCQIKGCTNPMAINYNPEATLDDGSCQIKGCTDPTAINYNVQANIEDGSCKFPKDLFIGKWTATLACDNAIIQNFIAGQSIEIIIEEIPNEKAKVKISIGFVIPGVEPTTGIIDGNRLTYDSPEQTLTLPQLGEIKISNSGELIAGSDPNKLTGEITLNITLQGLPLASTCTVTAIRKL